MTLRWLVRPNTYHDSVTLMRLSEMLSGQPGVARAAAVMATPLNIELLANDSLLPESLPLSPDDLLVAAFGEDTGALDAALGRVDELLAPRAPIGHADDPAARTLEQVVALDSPNLAVIAVPGPFAALEAFAALRSGLHVFLFSDNVTLEDEIRLKELAAREDRLLMGPDCGTAIINGIGLGFANRVERGPVGIVGASGTGIQQVCCLLDAAGIGIAQAIGTGGRDLTTAVGGSMTRRALRLLAADDTVDVIAVISKPSDAAAVRSLRQELTDLGKPVVACLLGGYRGALWAMGDDDHAQGSPGAPLVRYARTLTDAAGWICGRLGATIPKSWKEIAVERRHAGFHSRVYGLFTGGTLAAEAGQILDGMGVPHALVDLGADRYTQGRAHPMIDPRLRASLIGDVVRHGDAGALLVDVILGDLAHPDPAGALLEGLAELGPRSGMTQGVAQRVPVIAVLVGARHDPQDLRRQRSVLEEAGIRVFASNAQASAAAGALVGGDPGQHPESHPGGTRRGITG